MSSITIEKILSTDQDVISKGRIYTFLNPVSYLEAEKNEDLFSSFDGIFIDGSILAKAIWLLYGKKVSRRSFDMTSIGAEIFDYATKERKGIYIVSSEQNNVELAVNHIKERFNGIQIIGYRNGYFKNEEEKNLEIQKIISENPGIACSIIINGDNYEVNGVGFNFVVYDRVTQKVVDSACFYRNEYGEYCKR